MYEKAKISPDAQELLRIREKARLDYASDIKTAKDEGREEERVKNAQIIAKRFGVSLEEVEKILNEDA